MRRATRRQGRQVFYFPFLRECACRTSTHGAFVVACFSSPIYLHTLLPKITHNALRTTQVADGEGAAELVNADVGGISFTDVRFGYGPDRDILQGLTFEASLGRAGPGRAGPGRAGPDRETMGGGGADVDVDLGVCARQRRRWGVRCSSLSRLVVGVPYIPSWLDCVDFPLGVLLLSGACWLPSCFHPSFFLCLACFDRANAF